MRPERALFGPAKFRSGPACSILAAAFIVRRFTERWFCLKLSVEGAGRRNGAYLAIGLSRFSRRFATVRLLSVSCWQRSR